MKVRTSRGLRNTVGAAAPWRGEAVGEYDEFEPQFRR
jgi:hypothetical protein